jgi:hypothetical protein
MNKTTAAKTTKKNAVDIADTATYQCATSEAAWAFYRACCNAGFIAGFPGLKSDGLHTVKVLVETWMAREQIDAIANGAPCVEYEFGKKG